MWDWSTQRSSLNSQPFHMVLLHFFIIIRYPCLSSNTMSIEKKVNEIATSSWTHSFIRLGHFIRGILYASIGVFALISVLGIHESMNQVNIITVLSHLPFGYFLIIVFLFGLAGYSLWGFMRAILDKIDRGSPPISFFKRCGYIFSGVVYASLIIPTYALLVHKHTTTTLSFSNVADMAQKIIQFPLGQFLLELVAIIWCIGSLLQIYKAFSSTTADDLNYDTDELKAKRLFVPLSRFAIAARGFTWLIMSVFLFIAAYHADPGQAKSMNDIFNATSLFPLLHIFLGFLAFGFILFGVYSCSLAFWIDNLPNKKS